MATPRMQIDKLKSSERAMDSPKNKKAITVAKMGEVLFKKATFDSEISLIAVLKTKNVIVPDIARISISFHE